MQLKTKVGFALLAAGIGIFAAFRFWTKTRNFVPVEIPLTMARDTSVTAEFKLNLDGLYRIEIEAEKSLPLETLHCLMGVEADAAQCKNTSPAIGAAWILSAHGQEISRGSSSEMHSEPARSEEVTRVIGEFPGQAGQDYKLQVTFTGDGRSLGAARPRLKVGVANIIYTDIHAARVLVFSATFTCTLFGVILLSIASFARSESRLVGSSR